ncbi:MAG: hypothetical protein AB8A37_05100, partial [Prochlorococcus sp.]
GTSITGCSKNWPALRPDTGGLQVVVIFKRSSMLLTDMHNQSIEIDPLMPNAQLPMQTELAPRSQHQTQY